MSKLPPLPADAREAARVEHTRLLRRIMDDESTGFKADLNRRLLAAIGPTKLEAWSQGVLDLSTPAYAQIWDSIAHSYDSPPIIGNTEQSASLGVTLSGSVLLTLVALLIHLFA